MRVQRERKWEERKERSQTAWQTDLDSPSQCDWAVRNWVQPSQRHRAATSPLQPSCSLSTSLIAEGQRKEALPEEMRRSEKREKGVSRKMTPANDWGMAAARRQGARRRVSLGEENGDKSLFAPRCPVSFFFSFFFPFLAHTVEVSLLFLLSQDANSEALRTRIDP